MNDLSGLTIDQLALAVAGEERLPLDAVLAECRRRQRMLEAAEGMAKAVETMGQICGYQTMDVRSAFVAYQQAKGER